MIKRAFIRVACLLFLFCLICSASLPVGALSYTGLPSTDAAESVYFYNIDAGELLLKKGGNTKIAPASSVKIMTGLIACEMLGDKLDTEVTIKKGMISASKGTSMKLTEGDTLTVRDLMYGALCSGFNDAAYALASVCCKNPSDFVAKMNERAAELGALNTYYTNPTGYDDKNAYTTLEDTATIAKAAIKNELYMEITSTISKKIDFKNGRDSLTVYNRNGLISAYYTKDFTNNYAKGLIAGVTDLGGHCVITNAVIRGSSYLCIVMGGKESGGVIGSYSIANELIEYAVSNLGVISLMDEGTYVCSIPVDHAQSGMTESDTEPTIKVRTAREATAFLPLGTDIASRVSYRYYLFSERLSAPVEPGTVVGAIDFYCDGEHIESVPLVVNARVDSNPLLVGISSMRSAIISRTAIISLICFICLTPIWHCLLNGKKRRYKNVKEIKLKRL